VLPTNDGLNSTPEPPVTMSDAPVAMSNDRSRVSVPSRPGAASGTARLFDNVCSALMQYAMRCRLSRFHFGLPQNSP